VFAFPFPNGFLELASVGVFCSFELAFILCYIGQVPFVYVRDSKGRLKLFRRFRRRFAFLKLPLIRITDRG
jgi:hypothetical protein